MSICKLVSLKVKVGKENTNVNLINIFIYSVYCILKITYCRFTGNTSKLIIPCYMGPNLLNIPTNQRQRLV